MIWTVLLDPRCFAIVDRLWPMLVMLFAEWDRLKITGFAKSEAIADDVVGVRWSWLHADDAGE